MNQIVSQEKTQDEFVKVNRLKKLLVDLKPFKGDQIQIQLSDAQCNIIVEAVQNDFRGVLATI